VDKAISNTLPACIAANATLTQATNNVTAGQWSYGGDISSGKPQFPLYLNKIVVTIKPPAGVADAVTEWAMGQMVQLIIAGSSYNVGTLAGLMTVPLGTFTTATTTTVNAPSGTDREQRLPLMELGTDDTFAVQLATIKSVAAPSSSVDIPFSIEFKGQRRRAQAAKGTDVAACVT